MAKSLRIGLSCLVVGAVAGASVAVVADPTPIAVSNYSFESGRVTDPSNPESGFGITLDIGSWNVKDQGSSTNMGNLGIFANDKSVSGDGTGTFFSNADDGSGTGPTHQTGAQLGYIFSLTGDEFQQTVPSGTFATGQSYTLTVAAALGGLETPPHDPATEDDHLSIELFYTNPGGDPTVAADRIPVAAAASFAASTLPISSDGPTDPATALLDVSTTTGPITDSNANGRPINVLIFTPDDGGGEFDIDNVRLTSVPEPASLGALAFGGLALVRRRRR